MNNKKIKVISSMAVAGLLTLNVFSANALVAQAKEVDDTVNATRPLGVYRSLISGENKAVAPVVVQKDKTTFADDYVTVNELVNSDKISTITAFNGKSINSVSKKEMVKTGDTITIAGGETVTVVVYGDVNKDGLVDGDDASEILKYDVGGRTFDSIEKLAADVKNSGNNKGVVDGDDASHILKYDVGTEKAIEVEPDAEVVQYDYTLEVNKDEEANRVNVVNSTNATSSSVIIKLAERETAITGLRLIAEDSNGVKNTPVTVPTINAHTSQITVERVNFNTLSNGTITLYLQDTTKNNEVVGAVEVIKDNETTTITAANVKTQRTGTETATLSLEGYGKYNVVKVHYIVDEVTETDDGSGNITYGYVNRTLANLTNEITVTGNKLENYTVKNNCVRGKAYTVSYALENEYGSISAVKRVIISKDNVQKLDATEITKIPDLTANAPYNFEWKAVTNATAGYTVNLIKDGKVIKVVENQRTTSINTLVNDMTEEGNYKISVKANGNEAYEDSDTVESEEVTVTRLEEVTNVTLENLENVVGKNAKLSWDKPNNEEDIFGFDVDLYYLDDTTGKIVPRQEGATNNISASIFDQFKNKDKIEFQVNLNPNKIYYAKVKVIAKTLQKAIIESKGEAMSNQMFIVETPTVTAPSATSSDTATLKLNRPISILGKTTQYKVEVYKYQNADKEEAECTYVETQNVTLDKNNVIEVKGLEANQKYSFKLVAIVDGIESKSNFTTSIKTFRAIPAISDLIVTKNKSEALQENSGKIYADATTIVVNGSEEYNYSATDIGSKDKRNAKIVALLDAGDVVTIDGDNISLTLNGVERTVNFASIIAANEDVILNITTNGYAKTLTSTTIINQVNLNGDGAIYFANGLKAKSITLDNGVKVKDGNAIAYTLNPNAKVTIGDVGVQTVIKTDIKATIAAGTNTLQVTANIASNTLTFDNNSSATTTVKFEGLDNGSSVQEGTININSNGTGSVILRKGTNNVNIKANVNVVAKSGTIDLQEKTLNGAKNVNVTKAKDATVTVSFLADTIAPKALNTFAIDATDDEIKEELNIKKTVEDSDGNETNVIKEDSELTDADKEKISQLKAYLSSFGVNGKGAEITNNGKTNVTTINFPTTDKAVDTTIENIK